MPKPSNPFAPVTSVARLRLLAVATLLLAATAFGALLSPVAKSARVAGSETNDGSKRPLSRDEAAATYTKLPLLFEANAGQTDESVRFISRGVGYNLFLTRDEAVLALRDRTVKIEEEKPGAEHRLTPASYRVLRMRLDGAERAPETEGLDEQTGKLNYFIGNDPEQWRTNVPVYEKVLYRNVYRGIDLVYYGNQRQLEYDFQVAPGADPRAIRLRFEGAGRARVEPEGDLVLELAGGEVRLRKPFIYQTTADGGRREVEGRYVVKGRNAASFEVGAYDRSRALVIDPIISYASYLGSPGGEFGYGVAVDSSGNAYVTGETSSLSFPTTGQTFATDNFSTQAFVTKVNPTGSALVYSTFIGGNAGDVGFGIAVDGSGSAYVTGRTSSSNFPTTGNAIRGAAGLLKSTNAGGNWTPSTTGMGNNSVLSLAIDPTNNAVVYAGTLTGARVYKSTDGGATWAGLNPGFGGPAAIVVDPQNPSNVYAANNASFFAVMKSTNGGASWTQANTGLAGGFLNTLAINPANPSTLYVGTNAGVFKTTNGGANWASVNNGANLFSALSIAIDPTNTSVVYTASGSSVYKTTNGGTSWTQKNTGLSTSAVRSIVIDPTNTSVVYAATFGGGVFKTTNGGDNWSPVNTGLTNLNVNVIERDAGSASTLYAGTSANGIFRTIDGGGNWTQVYGGLAATNVVALASGPASTVLAGVDQRAGSFSSETEAFVTKLSPAGNALVYSTYLGGTGNDDGLGIAVNSAGQAHVVGSTGSADFPVVNPRQATFAAGISDAYVTKLDAAGGSIIYSTYLGGTGIDSARGVAVDASGNAYVAGQTNSTNFPVTAGAFQTVNGNSNPSFGDGDAFVAKLDPAGSSLLYSTYLGGTGNEIGYGVAADSAGNAYVAGQTTSNNFPVLNAAQPKYMGGSFSGDAFATKLNPAGNGLVYSTYLGGSGSDHARGVALVPDGSVVVAGGTDSIDFNVTPDTLLNNSRLFRSTDGGANWDNHNTGLTGSFNYIAVDPQTPTRLYALTSGGLFRSTDEGRSWTPHGTGLNTCCLERLAIDPQNPSVMYVTKLTQPGIYKSIDGGATWLPSNGNLFFNNAKPIAIDPTATGTLYVGDFGVYKSTNGGSTWASASGGIPGGTQINSITIDPTNPSTLYATGGSFARLYKSTNGGGSWALADTTMPPIAQTFKVVVAPTNPSTVYAVTTNGLYKSVDGAANWTQSFNFNNPSDLVYDPANTSTLYLSLILPASGSNAFIYKSTDGGATWLPTSGPPFRIHQLAISTASVLFATTDTVSGGGLDAFVTKLSASGSSFLYSTYLGGHSGSNNASDMAFAVAADAAGNAYVVGWTGAGDFPATPEAFQGVNRGADEAFIAKLVESFNIGGTVTNGAMPQAGVRVVLSGDELRAVTTGADGTYSFANLRPGGNYAISANKSGFTYTPPSQTFNGLSANQTVNFSATTSATPFQTISGRISESGGAAVPGVTVKLTGTLLDFTTTDANGNYSFSVPAGGNYTLTPNALGFLFTPPAQTFNPLAGNSTADFTAVRQEIVVTNTNNHGPGSLRQAVADVNVIPGRDRIVFNIPGPGVKTITLLASLPDLTGPVEIDATTQPGYTGTPRVEVEGFGSGSGSGLRLTGGNSVVRGLAVYRFNGGSGVELVGDNNVVEGCYLGVNAAGQDSRANHTGLLVRGSNNRIGGTSGAARNVISGNTFEGLLLSGANNLVKGNFVGTNPAGTAAVPNGGRGIEVNSTSDPALTANNVIGGPENGARNVISGNGNSGILTGASGTVIQGNFIGTDVTGTVALGNGAGISLQGRNTIIGGNVPAARNVISGQGAGIQISTFVADPQNVIQGNYIGIDAGGTTALSNSIGIEINGQGTSIGGTQTGEGNVISGNTSTGIYCRLGGGAVIRGNLIGTDASGNLPVPNETGINVSTTNNQIGGSANGAGNVISGNVVGISLEASNNVIRGNFIGINTAVTTPNPNTLFGIRTSFGANNNQIGGDEPSEANAIAFNRVGVSVGGGNASTGILVRGNAIFSNAQLGIDLNEDGRVQANDQLDADTGANTLQNFPVLMSVSSASGSTHVEGTLHSTANTQFRIDFYSNAACDASGNGEGARPFGSTNVTTDAAGNAVINLNLSAMLAQGRALTATATDPANNTSEFSPCDAAAATGSVGFVEPGLDVLEDIGSAPLRVVRTGGRRGTLTVNYSTGAGTATAGADYTPVSGQLTFADGETEKVISLPIADDGVTETPENLFINLSGTPDLEQLGPHARLTVRILDSSTPLQLVPENPPSEGYTFTEGDAGTRNNTIAVRLSAATGRTVTVSYRTLTNIAQANIDYLPVSGTLTFAPGTVRQEVQLPIIGDTIDEFTEFFIFELFNASEGNIPLPQVFVNILDDDAPPTISVTDVTAVEGAGAKAAFTIRLSQPSGKGATVNFATANGTATAGSDYTAANGSVNFAVGQTVRTVEVELLGDAVAEGDETFVLNVVSTNQTRATVADGQGVATIIDQSSTSASLVQFSAAGYSVNEADGQVQINVTRTGNTAQAASVDYATASGSASERSDFTASLGTLRFAAGETSKSFNVLVTNDRYLEAPETLDLVLSNASGVSLGGPSVAALTINSEDTADGASPVGDVAFDTTFFVRQHYHDFLNREPDTSGLQFWVNEIEQCGANAQCREAKRVNVSAAFFLSIEFQQTGYLAYRTYKAAYGDATSPNVPGTIPVIRLREFLPDTQRIGQNVVVGRDGWEQQLEANKNAYMLEFVSRQRFTDAFPSSMTAAQFVDKLNQNSGGVLSQTERDQLVAQLAGSPDQTQGRAAVLRNVAEDEDMRRNENNRAFVLMQYYGYLRRNPDDPQDTDFRGWKFWLDKLNEFNGNFQQAEMVKAFISSDEYRRRFGQ